jgi:transcriptional regulator with XRE-family HTH domain
MSNMNITEKLIQLRKSKGISQEELAEKLDVSRQAISRWETGTALPDANNILALSKLW